MKTKVSELTGERLAEWTAKAQEWRKVFYVDQRTAAYSWEIDGVPTITCSGYRPDINGGQAMKLMKIFAICVNVQFTGEWIADICTNDLNKIEGIGQTPEIAICRAVVASVYGEYVEDT